MQLLLRNKIKIFSRRKFKQYNTINVRKDKIKFVLFDLLFEQLNFN